METQSKKKPFGPLLIVIVVLVVAVVVLGVLVLRRPAAGEITEIQDGNVPRIGYAVGVTVAEDQQSLQKAVDEMYAERGRDGIMLEFQNEATSYDGVNVDCYFANSIYNDADLYFGLYGDIDFTDQLFLSELVKPGFAFRTITLEHEVPRGDHEVYLVFTAVKDVDGVQTITSQIPVTLTLHVI